MIGITKNNSSVVEIVEFYLVSQMSGERSKRNDSIRHKLVRMPRMLGEYQLRVLGIFCFANWFIFIFINRRRHDNLF